MNALKSRKRKQRTKTEEFVGIFMGGATGKVSSALETYGDRPISNDIVKIKKVLERIQISWETPDGQNRAKKTILIKVIVNREYLSYRCQGLRIRPESFHGSCTLATCKPKLRKAASIGD